MCRHLLGASGTKPKCQASWGLPAGEGQRRDMDKTHLIMSGSDEYSEEKEAGWRRRVWDGFLRTEVVLRRRPRGRDSEDEKERVKRPSTERGNWPHNAVMPDFAFQMKPEFLKLVFHQPCWTTWSLHPNHAVLFPSATSTLAHARGAGGEPPKGSAPVGWGRAREGVNRSGRRSPSAVPGSWAGHKAHMVTERMHRWKRAWQHQLPWDLPGHTAHVLACWPHLHRACFLSAALYFSSGFLQWGAMVKLHWGKLHPGCSLWRFTVTFSVINALRSPVIKKCAELYVELAFSKLLDSRSLSPVAIYYIPSGALLRSVCRLTPGDDREPGSMAVINSWTLVGGGWLFEPMYFKFWPLLESPPKPPWYTPSRKHYSYFK